MRKKTPKKGLLGKERKDSQERMVRKGLLGKEGKDGEVRMQWQGKSC